MKTNWNPQVQAAEFLISSNDNATAVCPNHAQAFAVAAQLLHAPVDLYKLDPEDEPIACQVCWILHTPQ
jgi:hypothetical protein